MASSNPVTNIKVTPFGPSWATANERVRDVELKGRQHLQLADPSPAVRTPRVAASIRVVALAACPLVVPLTLVSWTAELLWFRSSLRRCFWRLRLAKRPCWQRLSGLVFT